MDLIVLKKTRNERPVLSLILPVYNGARFIAENLAIALNYLNSLGISHEIVVVDDGSEDSTWRKVLEVDAPAIGLYRIRKNCGKGMAVKVGMLQARGNYRAFTDADLPYDLSTLPRMLLLMQNEGVDVCLGDRYLEESVVSERIRLRRKILSFLSQKTVSLIVPIEKTDTQCGIKCFNKKAAERIFSKTSIARFAFDVEAIYLANLYGFRIKRVPVKMSEDLTGDSTVSFVADGLGAVRDLLKIRLNRLRNFY